MIGSNLFFKHPCWNVHEKGGRLHIVCKLNRFIWPSVLVRKASFGRMISENMRKTKISNMRKEEIIQFFHFINDLFKFELFMG